MCGAPAISALISVVSEAAVASGVRRIEAFTGNDGAREAQQFRHELARPSRAELSAPLDEVTARVAALVAERKRLERELSEVKKKLAMGGGGNAGAGADGLRTVGDVKLMARAVEGIELKDLRGLADEGKKQVGSGVVAIVGVTGEGKAGLVVGVTDGSDRALQCGRSRPQGRGSARRQRRRRAARHGAGGRSGRLEGGRRARRHRSGAGRIAQRSVTAPTAR